MSEISFSKKQLGPLITKYAINVEKNTLFRDVINLFKYSPNYHVWAVKSVFSMAVDMPTLEFIKSWADANGSSIKLLSKNGTITSYSTKEDFDLLIKEMHNIDRIGIVKQTANTFNTDQKRLILEDSCVNNVNPLNADKNTKFMEWFELLKKFRKIHPDWRNKTINSISSTRDIKNIKQLIADSLNGTYAWEKEDLLNFVATNTPDVRVIYNMGPIVILQIPSYKDSHKICFERTRWCITYDEYHFNRYILDHPDRSQYFFFDFSKPESHDLAHVGFTMSRSTGFTHAHSNSNVDMMGSGVLVDGQRWNMPKLLAHHNIGMGIFLNLGEMEGWHWEATSLLQFINGKSGAEVVFNQNNVVVLRITNADMLRKLVKFTFLPYTKFEINDKKQLYLIFNFNVKVDDNSSLYAVTYAKDKYNFLSNKSAYNIFGADVMKENFLGKLNISSDNFLSRDAIDPNILLHKYIDEHEEASAIRIIEDNKDSINVNFKLEDRLPIYTSLENGMFNVFASIVNHKTFDGNFNDENGENILQIILWSHYVTPQYQKNEFVDKLLIDLIESGKFDINFIDANEDTLLSIAALTTNCNWLTKYLVENPQVNVNTINDIGYTAFGNAIRYNNLEAARIIGTRPDIKLSENDIAAAQAKKLNLKDYLVPTEVKAQTTETKKERFVVNADYADVLSKMFNKSNN